MNTTKFKYVKFTKPELDRYVRDKNSCISLVNSEMHIGFPPWGFATFQETLTNIIGREKVGKYDSKLDGIVLDVRNIKVFGTSYVVHDDDPCNHINIKANFYVFKPRMGVVVRGCVKHISHGHVAVIIYRVFNVSIRFTSDEIRDRLSINQQITFRIKHFDLHGAMPYIEGELLNIRPLQVAQPAPVQAKGHLKFDDDGDTIGAVNGISNRGNAANKKITFADSSDSSDSERENEDKSELIDQLMFENIKIKKEKFSDSEEEAKYKNSKKRTEQSDDSSDSDSSDDDDDASTLRVKQENRSSSNSSSSSSSSSSSDSNSDSGDERVLRPDQIKMEKLSDASGTSDSSADSSDSSRSEKKSSRVTIKNEKVSDDENTKKSTKRKQNISVDNELDSFLETTAARSNRKLKTIDNGLNQPIDKLMVSFQSPGLSSTLKPEARKRKKMSRD